MSIIDSIKSIFKKKKKSKEPPVFVTPLDGEIIVDMASRSKSYTDLKYTIIDINPNVYLCNKAARVSIGQEVLDNEASRLKHIQTLVNKGHESVLEHTNVIALISVPYFLSDDSQESYEVIDIKRTYSCMMEILTNCKYLQTVISKKDDYIYILIGGSIRGYLNAIRESTVDNDIIKVIKDIVCHSINKEFLSSLITEKLIKESDCVYVSPGEVIEVKKDEDSIEADLIPMKDPEVIPGKHVDLVFAQDFKNIYNQVYEYGFDIFDVLKVTTITFLYHDISRAIGNQLVRHRVGITQSSQRYVLQENNKLINFIDPIKAHLDDPASSKYTVNHDIEQIESYLDKRNPFTVYNYLINHGIAKEDARMWLPLGVSTKIIMTFTYKQFMKFLDLRLDNSAQHEIRTLAFESMIHFKDKFNLDSKVSYLLKKYAIMPKAIRDDSMRESDDYIYIKEWVHQIEIDETSDTISEEPIGKKDESINIKPTSINTLEDAEKYFLESTKQFEDQ